MLVSNSAQLRVTLNSWSFRLYLPSAGIIGVCHISIQFTFRPHLEKAVWSILRVSSSVYAASTLMLATLEIWAFSWSMQAMGRGLEGGAVGPSYHSLSSLTVRISNALQMRNVSGLSFIFLHQRFLLLGLSHDPAQRKGTHRLFATWYFWVNLCFTDERNNLSGLGSFFLASVWVDWSPLWHSGSPLVSTLEFSSQQPQYVAQKHL